MNTSNLRDTSKNVLTLSANRAPQLRQVRPTLWRVLRTDGSVAGYIEAAPVEPGGGPRFEARRLVASTRQVSGIGDFASIDDALLCFH